MLDVLKLSFKNVSHDKLRTLFAAFIIGIAIFLVITFSMIQNCALNVEQLSNEKNPEYRLIYLSAKTISNGGDGGLLNLYQATNYLANLKTGEYISSVTLRYNDYNDEGKVSKFSDMYLLKKSIKKMHLFGYEIEQGERVLRTAVEGVDYFNTTNLEMAASVNPDFQLIRMGKDLDNSTREYEVIVDHITARRFCGEEKNALNKTVLIETGAETLRAKVVGVYDYYAYNPRSISETFEEKEVADSFDSFTYTEEELKEMHKVEHSDICAPVFINLSLRKAIGIDGKRIKGDRIESYAKFDGEIILTVDKIENLETVSNSIDGNMYYVSSKIDEAKASIKRMQFFRNILIFISCIVMVIGALNITNTMFMMVNERQHYIGIMSAIGMTRGRILLTLSFETLWISLVSIVIGMSLSYLAKFAFMSFLGNTLAESGLVRYIIIDFDLAFIGMILMASVVIAFLAGLYPVISGTRKNTITLLNL